MLIAKWHFIRPYFSQGLYVSAIDYRTADILSLFDGSDNTGQLVGQWWVDFLQIKQFAK